MSVSTKHVQYQDYEYTWQCLRDAYAGSGHIKGGAPALLLPSPGVKTAGVRYLPKPSGMDDDQYSAYRDRAVWLGATERAVHSIAEAISRKELFHTADELSPTLAQQLEDVTLTGVPLASFAGHLVREVLLIGRAGVLVDIPVDDTMVAPGAALSSFIAPAAVLRPYWCAYKAEDIVNWRTTSYQGRSVLTLVVLRECVGLLQGAWPSSDFFVTADRIQYRVLRLNEFGQYEVSLWVENPITALQRGSDAAMVASWIPTAYGQPLSFIPFMFFAPFSLEPTVEKSLMEALVEINFQHYRHSADREHGLHLTALPTPYVCSSSLDPNKVPPQFKVGSATAWVLFDSTAQVGMLEFKGQGLQSHKDAMEEDLRNMAALGARLLEGAPSVAETATGVMARSQGSDSPAKSLAKTISLGLTQALQVHAWLAGMTQVPDDPALYIRLNTDLVSTQMAPQMLTALMQAVLNGTMSRRTFYWNLERGEVMPPGVSFEEEQALLDAEAAEQPLAPLPMNRYVQGATNGTTVT